MQMPEVRTLDEYRAIYHREDLWLPAVEKILNRHGLSDQQCSRGPDGTHIVYFCGRSHVVKLFVPLFRQDALAEGLVAPRVRGALGIETPGIIGEGEVEGWRYLVMTRVPGRPLGEVLSRTSASERRAIAATVGEMIVRLRALPVAGLDPLGVDWPTFVAKQRETAVARQQECTLRWDPSIEIPSYFESSGRILEDQFEPALVLADITDEHVLVSDRGGPWRVTGYVDFGDSMVTHPDYEMVAPGLCIARGDRDVLRTLLLAAGYPEQEHGDPLRRRLMMCTLLHRYAKLDDLTALVPEARDADSLEDLARVLWPVC